jgi:hypothetical protein
MAMVCVVAGVGAQQGPPPAAQAPAAGAVSGVVIEAVTHRPIEGVNIQLGPPPRGGARLGNQLTDEKGRFVFTNVGAGTYFINASKGGYGEGHYGPGAMGALGGNIILTEGQWFKTANVEMVKLGAIGGTVLDERGEPAVGAYVRVLKQIMVAGQPQLAAGPAARTDDRGEYRIANLLPGKYYITVPSVQHSVPASVSAADLEGVTAEQLAAVDPSAVRRDGLSARRNGGAIVDATTALILGNYLTPPPPVNGRTQAYPIVFYPGALALSGAAPVDLSSGGDKSGLDLTLQPMPAVRVSGRLDGPPDAYANYVLRLMPAGLEDLGNSSEAATTIVRPDGSFTFLNVPAGAYTLIASQSTFEFALRAASVGLRDPSLPLTPGVGRGGSGVSGGMVSSASTGVTYNTSAPTVVAHDHGGYARTPVSVGAADLAGLVVPLQRTVTLRGQIAYEDLTGPPPTFSADLSPANGSPALGVRSFSANPGSAPGSANAFTLPGLLPGEYVLRINTTTTVKSIVVDGEDSSRRPIVLKNGQDAAVVVTLTGKVIKLTGTIRDAGGAAVPQAAAILFPADKTLWTNYGINPTWIRPSVGSSNGTYQIANIKAGDYYVVGVEGVMSNAWQDPAFLESASASATRVTFDWGDAKVVDLKVMVKR